MELKRILHSTLNTQPIVRWFQPATLSWFWISPFLNWARCYYIHLKICIFWFDGRISVIEISCVSKTKIHRSIGRSSDFFNYFFFQLQCIVSFRWCRCATRIIFDNFPNDSIKFRLNVQLWHFDKDRSAIFMN